MSANKPVLPDNARRRFLRGLAAAPFAALCSSMPGLSFSADAGIDRAGNSKRFVFIILRGGMDGIAAVTPFADPALGSLRGNLLPSDSALLKLDSFFALHPAFTSLHALYEKKQMLVCHAVASPYRDRSHFDAQNVLEIGLAAPDQSAPGWLNRSAGLLPHNGSSAAMAIGQAVPPVLLGEAQVSSWAPAILPSPGDSTMQRLQALYGEDQFLAPRLEQALLANAMVQSQEMGRTRARQRNFSVLVNAAARFLAQDGGPSIAVLESDGWDTHANQGATRGQLANKFTELDNGLAQLQAGLGEHWAETVVAVVTEFGRTAALNGTQGTDHGTASAAFLLGGAVRGGQIAGQWPGLASGNLYEGRDLQPTTDIRSLFKTVLRDHLDMPADAIESLVFPDSSRAPYLPGLIA